MQRLITAVFILLLAALTAAMPVSVDTQLSKPTSSRPIDQKNDLDNFEGQLSVRHKNSTDNISQSKPIESHLDDPNYFEGDLDISQEMIDAYYGELNKTDDGQRVTRAITSNLNHLWPNGIVYYTYHSSVNTATQLLILGAIIEIERETCLQFRPRSSGDHIEFTGLGNTCSSAVGRAGGKQLIKLPASSTSTCRTHRIILHEICHAIGVWHEQSRPDRDQYIEVLYQNIEQRQQYNFDMKRQSETNNHGEVYDYASVMHYNLYAFSRNGLPTLRRRTSALANAIYNGQGRPTIGAEGHLSNSDIRQLNRLYSCPGYVTRGRLRIYARYGHGLPDTDGWLTGDSDPYVRVTAYTHNGYSRSLRTRDDHGDESPEWYQWLDFGVNSWTRFTVKVYDEDVGRDDSLSSTVPYNLNGHTTRTYIRMNCNSGYIYFDYHFQP